MEQLSFFLTFFMKHASLRVELKLGQLIEFSFESKYSLKQVLLGMNKSNTFSNYKECPAKILVYDAAEVFHDVKAKPGNTAFSWEELDLKNMRPLFHVSMSWMWPNLI